jgi:hypothetical protein
VSRSGRVRAETEERFPALHQFLGCYLGDWPADAATPLDAVDRAVAEYPVAQRRKVRRELAELLGSAGDDCGLRRVLNDGLGVNVHFRKPGEARAFAEAVERKLLQSIKSDYEDRRR